MPYTMVHSMFTLYVQNPIPPVIPPSPLLAALADVKTHIVLCAFHAFFRALPADNASIRQPLTSMSGTALYIRFFLSNIAFPWRHDVTEDIGILFGSLCVLC